MRKQLLRIDETSELLQITKPFVQLKGVSKVRRPSPPDPKGAPP